MVGDPIPKSISKVKALITGIDGQDGRLLAEHLTGLGIEVTGLSRRPVSPAGSPRVNFVRGDLADLKTLSAILEAKFDQIYLLGGVSDPHADADMHLVNVVSTEHILSVCLQSHPHTRIFIAGSCLIFDDADISPQSESTVGTPGGAYGQSKNDCRVLADIYRSRGLFVSYGILYNHESVLRPPRYITRHITKGVAEIALGMRQTLTIGNPEAIRDWGAATEYVEGFYLALLHSTAEEFVFATGRGRTVRDLYLHCFNRAGLNWETRVRADTSYAAAPQKTILIGDPSKALRLLNWQAKKTIENVLDEMLEADLCAAATAPNDHMSDPYRISNSA